MSYGVVNILSPSTSTGEGGGVHAFPVPDLDGVRLPDFDDFLRRIESSRALGDDRNRVIRELRAEAGECAKPGWDGYGAEPVQGQTLRNAEAFVRSLPYGTPMPAVVAEPDGQLDLEWYRSPSRLLSVSVSPDGDLHYAALIGPAKVYGTEPFFGDAPQQILQLIERISSG